MKIELGKSYKTKNGYTVDLMSIRDVYGGTEKRYLGIVRDGLPETFWYNESGRLYDLGISPFDIEKELKTKFEFKTKIQMQDGKLLAKWPKKEIMENFSGSTVKITIEILND